MQQLRGTIFWESQDLQQKVTASIALNPASNLDRFSRRRVEANLTIDPRRTLATARQDPTDNPEDQDSKKAAPGFQKSNSRPFRDSSCYHPIPSHVNEPMAVG